MVQFSLTSQRVKSIQPRKFLDAANRTTVGTVGLVERVDVRAVEIQPVGPRRGGAGRG